MTAYETRTVITWLSNDEGAYGEACEIVERLGVYDGADRLQEWLEQDLEDYGLPGVLLDLLRGALSEIDWQEVAREFKPDEWGDSDEAPEDEDDERIDSDEWQAGIDAIREREGREDRMSDRAIYNEGMLDAY